MFLGAIAVVAVSVAVLAVNPFQPQNFRATPEDLRLPVISEVWLALKDADNSYVDHSGEAFQTEMGFGISQ